MSVLGKSEISLAAELREDTDTAWVPDVANFVEFDLFEDLPDTDTSTEVFISWTTVVGVGGQRRLRPILSPRLHAQFHVATRELSSAIDSVLAPGVCGYRFGAAAGSGYSDEYVRFQDIGRGEAEAAGWIVSTDIASFFESLPLGNVLKSLVRQLGPEHTGPLASVFEIFARHGLPVLPAGYADARMLANAVLAEVDAQIAVPFARWVDDYRLFARKEKEALRAVDRLSAALAPVGLKLSKTKTRIVSREEFIRTSRRQLTSVYHPERGDPEADAARLRRVFVSSAAEPIQDRGALRFALARLGELGDVTAVDYCAEMITRLPWEAPRMVSYLSQFPERIGELDGWLEGVTKWAVASDEAWVLSRLTPLLELAPMSRELANTLEQHLMSTTDSPSWGLTLRLLARAGYRDTVEAELNRRSLDPRASAIALHVLGLEGRPTVDEMPALTAAISEVGLPALRAKSIL